MRAVFCYLWTKRLRTSVPFRGSSQSRASNKLPNGLAREIERRDRYHPWDQRSHSEEPPRQDLPEVGSGKQMCCAAVGHSEAARKLGNPSYCGNTLFLQILSVHGGPRKISCAEFNLEVSAIRLNRGSSMRIGLDELSDGAAGCDAYDWSCDGLYEEQKGPVYTAQRGRPTWSSWRNARRNWSSPRCHSTGSRPTSSQALDSFAGLVMGGGPQGAYEQERYPYLSSECALVRHAARARKTCPRACAWELSSWLWLWEHACKPGKPEVGFFEVTLDPISRYDPLWRGMPCQVYRHTFARRRL